jgi:small-conductance mechanosensitive channel
MDFELRCFTDVDTVLPTKSELLFQIHKQLAKARIDIPMPMRPREWLEPPREEGDLPDEKADRSSARGA